MQWRMWTLKSCTGLYPAARKQIEGVHKGVHSGTLVEMHPNKLTRLFPRASRSMIEANANLRPSKECQGVKVPDPSTLSKCCVRCRR
jgi:hypothetical protein